MAFDPQAAKTENDRINNLLMKEPEYANVDNDIKFIKKYEEEISTLENVIKGCQDEIRSFQKGILELKQGILGELLSLEGKTGFSKAPGLAHLMTIAEKYEVKDVNAVPPEYIVTKMTSSVDKKKLNAAIKNGEVDLNSNWLEVIPGNKTVCIE